MPPGSGTAGAAAGTVTVIGRRGGAAGRVMGGRACLRATALRIPRLRQRFLRHWSNRATCRCHLLPRGAHDLGGCRSSRGSLARLARHHRRTRCRSESLRRQAGPCRFHGISLRLGATRRSFLRYARIRARWAILRARAARHFRVARGPRPPMNRTALARLNRRQARREPPLTRRPAQDAPALARRPAQNIPVRRIAGLTALRHAGRPTRFQDRRAIRRTRLSRLGALAFLPLEPPLPLALEPPPARPLVLPLPGGTAARLRQGRHEPRAVRAPARGPVPPPVPARLRRSSPRLVRRPPPGPVPAGPRRRPVRVLAPRRPVPAGRPEALRGRRKVPEPRRSPAKLPEPRREPAREARPRPSGFLRGPLEPAPPHRRREPGDPRAERDRRPAPPERNGLRSPERRQLAVHAFEKPLRPLSRFLLHGPQK
jgi:hypothetical protein